MLKHKCSKWRFVSRAPVPNVKSVASKLIFCVACIEIKYKQPMKNVRNYWCRDKFMQKMCCFSQWHCIVPFFYRRKTISQCSIQMTKSFVLSDFFRRTEIIEIKWMIISNSEKHLCWSKLMNVTRKFPSKVSQEHMYKCMLHSFCLGFCLSNAITKHISKHAMAKQKIPFIVNNTKTHQYDMAEQMCVKSQMNY